MNLHISFGTQQKKFNKPQQLGIKPGYSAVQNTSNPLSKLEIKVPLSTFKAYNKISFKGNEAANLDLLSIEDKLSKNRAIWSSISGDEGHSLIATLNDSKFSLSIKNDKDFKKQCQLVIKDSNGEITHKITQDEYEKLINIFTSAICNNKPNTDYTNLIAHIVYEDLKNNIPWKETATTINLYEKENVYFKEKSYLLPNGNEISLIDMEKQESSPYMGTLNRHYYFFVTKKPDSPPKILHISYDFDLQCNFILGKYFKNNEIEYRITSSSELEPFESKISHQTRLDSEHRVLKSIKRQRNDIKGFFSNVKDEITEPMPQCEITEWLENEKDNLLKPLPDSTTIKVWFAKCNDQELYNRIIQIYSKFIEEYNKLKLSLEQHRNDNKNELNKLLNKFEEKYPSIKDTNREFKI